MVRMPSSMVLCDCKCHVYHGADAQFHGADGHVQCKVAIKLPLVLWCSFLHCALFYHLF